MKKPSKAAERQAGMAAERAKFEHKPRFLMWDIETTNLKATFGTILTIGWKWLDDPNVSVRTILDGQRARKGSWEDRSLVEHFIQEFNKADVHVTWYGEGFDLRMLRSKAIRYGLPPMAPVTHIDLWKTAKRKFNVHSNRLAVWEEFLGVEHQKTPLKFDHWLKAMHGDKGALDYIVEHNRADVLVLEDVFKRMRPWLENIPAYGLFVGEAHVCPACGSESMRRRGFKSAQTRVYQQWQCRDCGHWSRSSTAVGSSVLRNTIT